MPLQKPNHNGSFPGSPQEAHLNPRHDGASPPPAWHSSPPPPGGPLYGSPPPPQQGMSMTLGPPHPQPGMIYRPSAPHPQQQQQLLLPPWVLLGFQTGLYTQEAVYGPQGAKFDMVGNVFFEHEGGSKEYVLPYRRYDGKLCDPPQPEDDCCGFWHWAGVRTDYHWQSPHYPAGAAYR